MSVWGYMLVSVGALGGQKGASDSPGAGDRGDYQLSGMGHCEPNSSPI